MVFCYFNIDDFLIYFNKYVFCVFRENEHATIQVYGDMVEARVVMMTELKKVIEANPVFNDKLVFPSLRSSRLPALINQRYGC